MLKAKLPKFLRPLFWEIEVSNLDPINKRSDYVIKRILEYGDKKAVRWMAKNFSRAQIIRVLCTTRDISPKAANYWAVVFGIDEKRVRCLQKRYLEIRRSCWPY